MGNFLTQTSNSPYDKSLLKQLKQRTLKDLSECITVLSEDYPDAQCLDYSQFEDVFCPILDDAEPFFLKLQNKGDINGTVDVYEALAAFAIFSGEKFEKKVSYIFHLFDFDRSNSLESTEMVLTLQSATRGLCKFVNMTPPPLKSLEELTVNLFVLIDHDNNKRITFDEFLHWVKHNNELQEFLLEYANTQTYENMKKRFDTSYLVLRHYFISACENPSADFADEEALRKILTCDAKNYIRESDFDFLFQVLRDSTVGYSQGFLKGDEKVISKKAYETVMKAWSAFSASDINHDNKIVIHELHPLLWIYEDQEPSDVRVINEMHEIDKDRSGYIDRYEWLNNLCGVDKNGKTVFRNTLKVLFEKHDTDNSGSLSIDELKSLVKEAFKDYLRRARDEEMKKHLENMIDSLTTEIFQELDISGNNALKWEEFKDYMEVSLGKYSKLKSFLNLHV